MRYFGFLALLAGCTDPKPIDSIDLPGDDTGPDTDDTDTTCTVAVIGATPEDAAVGVYYRAPIQVSFDGDASGAIIEVRDEAGVAVAATAAWSAGNLQAELAVVLAPSSPYTLHVEVCGVTTETGFSTSDLGTPLTIAPEDLLGRTYVFNLADDARITQPPFLDAVAGSFLTVPLLFGVTASDASVVDLIGALGRHEDSGAYTQVLTEPTWDFPAGDFLEAPYFSASADEIVIVYTDIDIPIEQFTLAGTFSADGTQIVGGTASGYADSRYTGGLIQQEGNPNAMCEIAAAAGVACEACSDGEPYCLYVVAVDITATWEPGLTIVP